MSQSRIQDWIRYVQERAENVPENASQADAPPAGVPPADAPPADALPVGAPPTGGAEPEEQAAPRQAPLAAPASEAASVAQRTRAKRSLPRGMAVKPTAARAARRAARPAASGAAPGAAPDAAQERSRVNHEPGANGITARRTGQRQRLRPETRSQMLERLTNPTISLHEASVLLGVCSATVRRYTNSGLLPHARTQGGQRRFRLREVLLLLREMEAKRK